MPGLAVRFFAATAALTFLGVSAASAGWYGDNGCCAAPLPVANWGCASSGCAPVQWGCGSSCGYSGYANGGLGYGGLGYRGLGGCGSSCGYAGYANGGLGYGGLGTYEDVAGPIHLVNQGPSYDLPLTGYSYPVATYDVPRAYPYARGYSGYGYGYRHGYRPLGYRGYRPRVAQYHRPSSMYYPGMRHAPRVHYGPRRYIDK